MVSASEYSEVWAWILTSDIIRRVRIVQMNDRRATDAGCRTFTEPGMNVLPSTYASHQFHPPQFEIMDILSASDLMNGIEVNP